MVAIDAQVQAGKIDSIVARTLRTLERRTGVRCPAGFSPSPSPLDQMPRQSRLKRWGGLRFCDSARSASLTQGAGVFKHRDVPAVTLAGDVPPLLLPASNLAAIGGHDDQRSAVSCRRCPAGFA